MPALSAKGLHVSFQEVVTVLTLHTPLIGVDPSMHTLYWGCPGCLLICVQLDPLTVQPEGQE